MGSAIPSLSQGSHRVIQKYNGNLYLTVIIILWWNKCMFDNMASKFY